MTHHGFTEGNVFVDPRSSLKISSYAITMMDADENPTRIDPYRLKEAYKYGMPLNGTMRHATDQAYSITMSHLFYLGLNRQGKTCIIEEARRGRWMKAYNCTRPLAVVQYSGIYYPNETEGKSDEWGTMKKIEASIHFWPVDLHGYCKSLGSLEHEPVSDMDDLLLRFLNLGFKFATYCQGSSRHEASRMISHIVNRLYHEENDNKTYPFIAGYQEETKPNIALQTNANQATTRSESNR